MFLKLFALTAIFLVCEGTIPERFLQRRTPLRFIFNNNQRRPTTWNYEVVNGRPVISGYPNSNAYVAFGLNPQTGQIEQTQIITQTRPRGPFINMIQNMMNVAGQFFGQLTGAFGNAFGGALHTAGQFGQDIQDITNPVISVTGVSQPAAEEKEPIQQPIQTPQPAQPSTSAVTPTAAPSASAEIETTPSIETVPAEQAKSNFQPAMSVIDQAIIAIQTFKTNLQANFQNYFETEEGEIALHKVNENITWVINRLQNLRETAITEPQNVLQTGQTTVNTGFDNIELAVVDVTGTQGRDFIEPTRNELNKLFNDALAVYQEVVSAVETTANISPA